MGRQQCDRAWTAAEQAMRTATGHVQVVQGREQRHKQIQRVQLATMARARLAAANLRKARRSGMVAPHEPPEMQAFDTLAASLKGQAEAISTVSVSDQHATSTKLRRIKRASKFAQVQTRMYHNTATLMQLKQALQNIRAAAKAALARKQNNLKVAAPAITDKASAPSKPKRSSKQSTEHTAALVELKLALRKTKASLRNNANKIATNKQNTLITTLNLRKAQKTQISTKKQQKLPANAFAQRQTASGRSGEAEAIETESFLKTFREQNSRSREDTQVEPKRRWAEAIAAESLIGAMRLPKGGIASQEPPSIAHQKQEGEKRGKPDAAKQIFHDLQVEKATDTKRNMARTADLETQFVQLWAEAKSAQR